MVAIIKTGHSIHRVFNYNENKVKEGVAECIGHGNYPVDVAKMSLDMKLNRLLRQAELNPNCKRNSVHISLNFDPSENHLDNEKLKLIADSYMQKIGFGGQPYLVYRHHDAGHPHIHIVSLKVEQDGKRIDMQNIGRNQSEAARKTIEKEHDLVVAEQQKKLPFQSLRPVDAKIVDYGKTETKKAIQNVLENVLEKYRYASLPELNAVLNQYNIHADRGVESSRTFERRGLHYRVLGKDGKPIGTPIKASLFYNSPTLSFLEKRFEQNRYKNASSKARIKNVLDRILSGKLNTIEEFSKLLKKQGIDVVFRNNEQGILYGITYVDHTTKTVFNGSALGKDYGAKAILERCKNKHSKPQLLPEIATEPQPQQQLQTTTAYSDIKPTTLAESDIMNEDNTGGLLQTILDTEHTSDYIPNSLKKKKRRKKRKGNQNTNNN